MFRERARAEVVGWSLGLGVAGVVSSLGLTCALGDLENTSPFNLRALGEGGGRAYSPRLCRKQSLVPRF